VSKQHKTNEFRWPLFAIARTKFYYFKWFI